MHAVLRSSLRDHPALTLSDYMRIVALCKVESKWAQKSAGKQCLRAIQKANFYKQTAQLYHIN